MTDRDRFHLHILPSCPLFRERVRDIWDPRREIVAVLSPGSEMQVQVQWAGKHRLARARKRK